jgi:hypothetical protein
MLCRVARLPLIVVIRLVVKLLFEYVFSPLLCNRLKRLQGIASSSVGREEAWVAPAETISTSPKKTLGAEYETTRQYEAIQAANIFHSEIQGSPPRQKPSPPMQNRRVPTIKVVNHA